MALQAQRGSLFRSRSVASARPRLALISTQRRTATHSLQQLTGAPETTSTLEVQNRTVNVGGTASEVLTIPANGTPKLQVLLVPGNPGSARYYVEHLRQQHAALGGEAEVLAISHAGHAPHLALSPGNSALRSIHDQIKHKADFMREHLLLPHRPPLVVIGHSIGAYVAVNAVHQVEAEPYVGPPVLQVHALMGFFSINKASPEIKAHRFVAAGYNLMGSVAHVIAMMPAGARQAIVKYFSGGGMDKDAEELTQQLLAYSSVRNNFYMAHTEYSLLDQPPPWNVLEGLGRRLHVLGCPNDYWLSEGQYQELVQRLPSMQATWEPEVGHAYCTSRTQCRLISAILRDVIHAGMEAIGKPPGP